MRLLPLAAVLLLAALPGRAEPGAPPTAEQARARSAALFGDLEKRIVADRDPAAARAFLDRTEDHLALRRADIAAFDRVFLAATQLADLAQVLTDHAAPTSMREALGQRLGYPLLQNPAELLAWQARHVKGANADALKRSILDWATLPVPVRTALTGAGAKEEAWRTLSVGGRHGALQRALAPVVERMLKSTARTAAEAQALRDQAHIIWDYLDKSVRAELLRHFEKTDAVASALADAQARVAAEKDPVKAAALKAKLAEARKAGDADAMLGKLGELFDGMSVTNAAVASAGPGRADQRLSNKERLALSEMLRDGVKREMAGTEVGDRLLRMYAKEPFNLVVKPMPAGIMGQYTAQDNILAVSEDLITRMARERGKTAQDLLSGETFDFVLNATLSTIVHEAVHQEQAVWRRDGKIPYWDVVEHEMEAKSLEAAFILQKAAQDPKGYGRFLAENQRASVFIREGALLADKMRRSPKTFRMSVQADYYPAEVSIEASAARAYDEGILRELVGAVRAEQSRRAALPEPARRALDATAAPIPGGAHKLDAWKTAIRTLSAESLRTLDSNWGGALTDKARSRAEMPRLYAAYRRRDAETQALTARVLAALDDPSRNWASGPAGTKAGFVPPPAGGGGRR